ncbi:BTB/POZ domain-containing protein [Phthorimaea operculella]|nr:BTB/POZ domain-containing protein [Phthorimaea operculella]
MDDKQTPVGGEEHYSLRWNNHQAHLLRSFEALLHAETLVDVTLVCAELRVRAHKVLLGACSPLFRRIFSENPCKHPVIVLKDFQGWEVQAVVDFMYRGEVSVAQEQLSTVIRAGESLQVVRNAVVDDQLPTQWIIITKTGLPNPNHCQEVAKPFAINATYALISCDEKLEQLEHNSHRKKLDLPKTRDDEVVQKYEELVRDEVATWDVDAPIEEEWGKVKKLLTEVAVSRMWRVLDCSVIAVVLNEGLHAPYRGITRSFRPRFHSAQVLPGPFSVI